MTYTVELEKDGRICLPEDLRNSLHLKPGAKLTVESEPASQVLTLRSEEAEDLMYEDRGALVYRSSYPNSTLDVVAEIAKMREERMQHLMGWSTRDE